MFKNIVCLEEILPLVKKSLVPFERGATVREHCAFCKSNCCISSKQYYRTSFCGKIGLLKDTMPVCRDSASRAPYLAISPCTPLQRLLLGSRVIPPKPRGRRCRDLGPDFFVLCVLLLVCFGCVCPKDRNSRGEVANGPGETLQRVGSFRCKPQTAFKKLQR